MATRGIPPTSSLRGARPSSAAACGITMSRGFLALLQKEPQPQVPIPVATSSLLQAPLIEAMLLAVANRSASSPSRPRH